MELTQGDLPGHRIYMREHAVLNHQNALGWEAVGLGEEEEKKRLPKDDAKAREITRWMCDNFFDIRTFGAVMTTGVNCGQVRGPVQLTLARSVEPVLPIELSITRMAATNESESGSKSDNRTMGRKHVVPYGLYRMHGYVSAPLRERGEGWHRLLRRRPRPPVGKRWRTCSSTTARPPGERDDRPRPEDLPPQEPDRQRPRAQALRDREGREAPQGRAGTSSAIPPATCRPHAPSRTTRSGCTRAGSRRTSR